MRSTLAMGLLSLSVSLCGTSCHSFRVSGEKTSAGESRSGIDLRPRFAEYGLTPKDQAPRGCCSLFALCGVLEYEYAEAKPDAPAARLSEEYLNWASHQTNGRRSDGSFFSDALNGLATFGICRQELMPYKRKFQPEVEPSASAFADARERRNVGAVWIKPWDVKTGMTEPMLAEIRHQLDDGHPVAVGLRWPKKAAFAADGLLVVPPADQVFDGHSIVFVGWKDDQAAPGGGYFLFRNSHGADWREQGYGRMPYAYAAAYGNDAVALRIGTGKPQPCNRGATAPLEFELLPAEPIGACIGTAQDMRSWGSGRWSGGKQLFCRASAGGGLSVSLPPVSPGTYRLGLFGTRAPDYGIVRIWLDGTLIAEGIDLYAARVEPTDRIPLGQVAIAGNTSQLRVEVSGRNGKSGGTLFGLDCLELVPVNGTGRP